MRRWIFALVALCLPATLHAQWREASTAHFLLYADAGEAELRAAAALLEDYDRLLRRLMELDDRPGERVRIYLMADRDAVIATTDGSDPELAGYYTRGAAGPILVAPRTDTGTGRFDIPARAVLFHEYAHHMMLRHGAASLPLWYAEGLAEYYATAVPLGTRGFEIGAPPPHRLAVLAESSDWIPVGALLAADDYRQFAGRLHLLYAEGWLLTHFASQDARRRGEFLAYFAAVAAGAPRDEALATAFGPDVEALDRDLRAYAGRPLHLGRLVTLASAPSPRIDLRLLRPAETALIGFEVALGRAEPPPDPAGFLDRLRAAGRPFAGDSDARLLIARAERRLGAAASDGSGRGGR